MILIVRWAKTGIAISLDIKSTLCSLFMNCEKAGARSNGLQLPRREKTNTEPFCTRSGRAEAHWRRPRLFENLNASSVPRLPSLGPDNVITFDLQPVSAEGYHVIRSKTGK